MAERRRRLLEGGRQTMINRGAILDIGYER